MEAIATSGKLDPVVAIVGDIKPVVPSDPDKQKVTLVDGSRQLSCTFHGQEAFLKEEDIGKKIQIADGPWLSIFDDGGRHLTVRASNTVRLRDMNDKERQAQKGQQLDRLSTLAKHYDLCLGRAKEIAQKHGLSLAEAQPIGTCLYMDTKAHALVAPPEKERPGAAASTASGGEKPMCLPPEHQTKPNPPAGEGKVLSKDELLKEYRDLETKELRKRLLAALPFNNKLNTAAMLKREALIEVASNNEEIDWKEIYDALWHKQDAPVQDAMDAFIKRATEQNPNKNELILITTFLSIFGEWLDEQE